MGRKKRSIASWPKGDPRTKEHMAKMLRTPCRKVHTCVFCNEPFHPRSHSGKQKFCEQCVPAGGGRGYEIARNYGITPAQHGELWAKQKGLCALCPSPLDQGKFYIDHCHKTYVVRGLLCARCNQGMSFIDLETDWLERAQSYKRTPGIPMIESCRVRSAFFKEYRESRKRNNV